MDRQLLLTFLVASLVGVGCSREKSAPPTAAVTPKQDAAAPPSPDLAPTQAQLEFQAAQQAYAEQQRHWAEAQHSSQQASQAPSVEYRKTSQYDFGASTIEGNLLKPSGADIQSPAAPAPHFGPSANPLRVESAPPIPSLPTLDIGIGNPLRLPLVDRVSSGSTAESWPGTFAQPSFAPPASAPLGGGSPSASEPSGGAAMAPRDTRASGAADPTIPRSPGIITSADVIVAQAEPKPVAPAETPFELVEVYYGTDRKADERPASDWHNIVRCFWPTVSAGLMAVCLGTIAVSRRSWLLGSLAAVGIVATFALGYEDADEALRLVRGAGKLGPRYTTERAANGHVELGRCQVTIPTTKHKSGELESPSILRLEIHEDAAENVILQNTERLADSSFYELLRERVNQSARRELFIFIHGFNVSFEDAARRTAQIHYDLKFDGAPIFFSWPAHDRFLLTYPADETNVSWSTPHFKQFLLEIVKESGAASINLIAHSMGNRALTAALREIELQMRDQARLFNQVVLAAPDIDADDFKNNIAPAMQRTAQRLTLYASAHDEALLASRFIHRSPRAGDAGAGLIVVPGIDTIDVTPIDYSLWGHSYYGSSNPVLHDLQMLLTRAVPPRDRTWLAPAEHEGLIYWIFQPARTASADGTSLK